MKIIYKDSIKFLEFIKYNKRYVNSLISNITSDKTKPKTEKIISYNIKTNEPTKRMEYQPISFDDNIGFDTDKIDYQINHYEYEDIPKGMDIASFLENEIMS